MSTRDIRLFRIEGFLFTAGIVVQNGKVVESAPILKRYLNRDWVDVKKLLDKKGWKVKEI